MTRIAILVLSLLAAPAAANDPAEETGPNFNDLSRQEVPEDIPKDRCVMAIYEPKLREDRGLRIEGWRPPVSDRTRRWLYTQRSQGNLTLIFCDEEKI